jgi:hypothetical protein
MEFMDTDVDFEFRWMNMRLPGDRMIDRDVWHLATLANMECYEQFCNHEEWPLKVYWSDMSHSIGYERDPAWEGGLTYILLASNSNFQDKEVVRFRVYKDGKHAEITFGKWMDSKTLKVYHDVFRKWMDIMKKVTEERVWEIDTSASDKEC